MSPGQLQNADWVLDLIHQGLLPLSSKTLLTARLVCKHWQQRLSTDIHQLTLPFDAWATSSRAASGSNARAAGSIAAAMGLDQTGWRTAATAAAAALAAVREEVGLEEATEAEGGVVKPRRGQRNAGKASKTATAAAAAAVEGAPEAAAAAAASVVELSDATPEQQQQAQQQQPGVSDPLHLQVEQQTCTARPPGSADAAKQLSNSSSIDTMSAMQPATAEIAQARMQPHAATKGQTGSQPSAAASTQAAADGTTAQQQQQQGHARAHPLHLLPSSLPACTHITLSNRRSLYYDPQAPCGSAAVAAAVACIAQLPQLSSLCVQGYMPAADWQPLLSVFARPQQQQQQDGETQVQQQQQQQAVAQAGQQGVQQQDVADMDLDTQHPGSVIDSEAVPGPCLAEIGLAFGAQSGQHQQTADQQCSLHPQQPPADEQAQRQEQQQEQRQPPPPQQQQQQEQQQPSCGQQLSLCTRLVTLDLQSLELPPPLLLEAALSGLRGLRQLTLHASMESILEAAHLEALSTGSQLTSLALLVYQAAHSRCPLDPLMALTHLRHLEVGYGGIFNDQRPVLADPLLMSRLVNLTSLASSGLAQPLLPQPNITTLRSLRVSGLTKRLSESAVSLIGCCSSSALVDLRLEAGRRGIAAVAAEQLCHLGSMVQVTSLSLALSKGGLPAGKSAQQLQQLAALTALKTLWLGSGDHRLGLSSQQLQELGGQWPGLESLRLSGFSPLQGFAGLGAFTGLTALSMKPGVGTGKVLNDLDVALQQLSLLRRLHIDFRSGLTLEHIEPISSACGSRLQHLSLNMWAPGIGSKALVAVGQLSVLTSLQLLNLRAAVLSGPPGIIALREMPSLQLLCVQAADEVITEQQPLSLGGYLSEVLEGHRGPLREVRVWLGSGVEARQAEAGVAAVVEAHLPDCRCRVLKEPEKPIL